MSGPSARTDELAWLDPWWQALQGPLRANGWEPVDDACRRLSARYARLELRYRQAALPELAVAVHPTAADRAAGRLVETLRLELRSPAHAGQLLGAADEFVVATDLLAVEGWAPWNFEADVPEGNWEWKAAAPLAALDDFIVQIHAAPLPVRARLWRGSRLVADADFTRAGLRALLRRAVGEATRQAYIARSRLDAVKGE